MPDDHGVYFSYRLPSGELFSSSRETVAELLGDVELFFGETTAKNLQSRMVREADNGIPKFEGTRNEAPVAGKEANKVDFGGAEVSTDDFPEGGFEECDVCGTVKDKWNPPGTSKRTGKTYPGFFGCPNFRNHPR